MYAVCRRFWNQNNRQISVYNIFKNKKQDYLSNTHRVDNFNGSFKFHWEFREAFVFFLIAHNICDTEFCKYFYLWKIVWIHGNVKILTRNLVGNLFGNMCLNCTTLYRTTIIHLQDSFSVQIVAICLLKINMKKIYYIFNDANSRMLLIVPYFSLKWRPKIVFLIWKDALKTQHLRDLRRNF